MNRVQRDYYDVLGVAPDADATQIRQAFRALARLYHPDVSSDADADERFREVARAYRVLSRPLARLLYDRYGYVVQPDGVLAAPGDDTAAQATVLTEVEIESVEAERGTTRTVDVTGREMCRECEGTGAAEGTPVDVCETCEGGGRLTRPSTVAERVARFLEVEACPRCGGSGRVARPCRRCDGTGQVSLDRRVTVPIPAGVHGGEVLRVGDVEVRLRVRPERDRRVVRYAAFVALWFAVSLFVELLLTG
jgi:molecular chaperone DnaJ